MPWQSDNWPAMPVMRVIESSTVARAMPELKTASQVLGIQVSMDTAKPARITHHRRRIHLSMVGTREDDAAGGGGGSMVARGSLLRSSSRIPGRMSNAATSTKNGSPGITAENSRLPVGA